MPRLSKSAVSDALAVFLSKLDTLKSSYSKKSSGQCDREIRITQDENLSIMQVKECREGQGNPRVANVDQLANLTNILRFFVTHDHISPLSAAFCLSAYARSSFLEHMRIRSAEYTRDMKTAAKHTWKGLESSTFVKTLMTSVKNLEEQIDKEIESRARQKTYGSEDVERYSEADLRTIIRKYNNFYMGLNGDNGSLRTISEIPVSEDFMSQVIGVLGFNKTKKKNDLSTETRKKIYDYWKALNENLITEEEFLIAINHGLTSLYYACTLQNPYSDKAKHEKLLETHIKELEGMIGDKLITKYQALREYLREHPPEQDEDFTSLRQPTSSNDSPDGERRKARAVAAESVSEVSKRKERKKAVKTPDSDEDEADAKQARVKIAPDADVDEDAAETTVTQSTRKKKGEKPVRVSQNPHATFSDDEGLPAPSSSRKSRKPVVEASEADVSEDAELQSDDAECSL